MKGVALHKLAKDLNVTSKDVLALLKEKNIPAKSALMVLTPEQHDAVLEHFTSKPVAPAIPAKAPASAPATGASTVAAAPATPAKAPAPVPATGAPAVKPAPPVAPVKPAPPAATVKPATPVQPAPAKPPTLAPAAPASASAPRPAVPVPASAPPVSAAPPPAPAPLPPLPPRRSFIYSGPVTLAELAKTMDVRASDIIRELLQDKQMITLNQRVGLEVIRVIADKFDFDVQERAAKDPLANVRGKAIEANLVPRAPIVTIMGHVDHGKTSLLDAIRKTNVTAGEAGGITQHISAFRVSLPGRGDVVFLDTPGHEAFTALRARGAKVTDVVVLVVAGDDGVMPQTIEAIDHAKAAGVPIVVAINKMDKPSANPMRVKQELTAHGLQAEDWGGKTIMVEVSALKQTGLDKLLEMLLLEAELLELKADPTGPAEGTVLEARMHKSRGPVATVLIQHGTLRVGDIVTCGSASGRVRMMLDDRGGSLKEAGPAVPVELLGLSQVTEAGATLHVVADEWTAREATERHRAMETEKRAMRRHITLQDVSQSVMAGEAKELRIIVKADVQGSLEALSASVGRLANAQVKLAVIHQGVGPVNASDIALAAASDAIIIGFHVQIEPQAEPLARQESVEVRTYDIIYNAIDELKKAMEGLLAPKIEEVALGKIEVRTTFRTPRGPVAGCFVTTGKAVRGEKLRVIRGGQVTHEGTLTSLRRFKEDVREVATGYECGISLDGFSDFQPGDIIEMFTQNLVQEKLRI